MGKEIEIGIDNIISEISKQYDNLCKEAFKKCGYAPEYVLNENPTAFSYCHSDFSTGYRDIYYLGDPTKGNALALFEIEQITDFEKNKIYINCKILNDSKEEVQSAFS